MIKKGVVCNAIRSRIGIRLLLIILPGILISMGTLIYFATGLVGDFGEYSASINEENIRDKTNLFMSRFIEEQAMRYENTFQKIALSSSLVAKQASLLLDYSDYIGKNPLLEKDALTFFPESGSFSNGRIGKTTVLYWGTPTISKEIEYQLKALSNIDPLLVKVKEDNPESVAAFIVTKSGMLRYHPNLHLVEKIKPIAEYDLRNGIWYRMAKPENNPSRSTLWTRVYQDEAGQGLMITAVSPVYGNSGEYLGVTGIDITLKNIIDKILGDVKSTDNFEDMGGMFSFLVDSRGNIITFPKDYTEKFGIKMENRREITYGDVLNYGLKDSRFAEIRTLGDAIVKEEKKTSSIFLAGEPFLIFSQVMPSTGWHLCVVIPESFILSSVNETRSAIASVVKKMNLKFTVITTALIVFYVLVIVIFLSRQMIIPLHKLTRAAFRVKEGDLTVHLDLQRKDEIGLLIRTFNRMVHELYASSIREKEHTKILEQTVEKRTQEIIRKNREQAETLRLLKTEFKKRAKVQNKLKESQEKYREIFENCVEGIFQSTIDNRLLSANPAMARILGYTSPEEILSMVTNVSDQLYVNAGERRKFIRFLEKEKTLSGFEVRFLRKDGSAIWVSLSARAVMDSEDALLYILGSIEDITQRKQAEEGFKIATRLAEDANRAKGEFLATMSHEIRTPMNAVLGMTEIVLKTRLNREQKRNLEIVHKSAEHLLSLINDILDFSRIEAGKLNLEETPFNLERLMKDVISMLSYKIESKGIKLAYRFEDVPLFLKGDHSRLRQIVVNLVNNAVKFTDKGGVDICVSSVKESGDGGDENTPPKVCLLFSIKDTGIGIPKEKLDTIFDLFTQLDASFTRSYGGTGLGLSISKKLVNLMGGDIRVESEVGRGSEFIFTIAFPLAAKDEIHAMESRASLSSESFPSDEPTKNNHILVAEDYAVNQEIITPVLEKCGYHVTIVENGQKAVEAVQQGHYDLVLMDVQMPVMDGLEATARIRNLENAGKASIPIIALTAHAMPENKAKCIRAGMNDYLSKPLKIKELIKAIEGVYKKEIPERSYALMEKEGGQHTDLHHALELMDGEEKLLSIACHSIIKHLPQNIIGLGDAVFVQDGQAMERFAHTIKTAARSVGAVRLSETAFLIEGLARKQASGEIERLLPNLESQAEGVISELRASVEKDSH